VLLGVPASWRELLAFSTSFSSTELFFFYLSLFFLAFPPLILGCDLT